MGLGIRTVQRYETRFALPVHRPAGRTRSAVLAFADELDRWVVRTPLRGLGMQPQRVADPETAA
jgi:hypothetical protein